MKSTAQKHLDAIESGTVEKTNVIGIRKVLAHVARLRAGYSGNRCNATPYEARTLELTLERVKPRVVGELHETGLELLRSRRYAKRWQPWQQAAIDAADHFRLSRFDRIGHGGLHMVPVYEVWAKVPPKGDAMDGGTYQAFSFRNIPWQSGGNGPEIVGSN